MNASKARNELPLTVTFTNIELNSPEEHVDYVLSTLVP